VKTFTVVFEGEEFAFYNEKKIACAVSSYLQTDHHELCVSEVNSIEVLDLIKFLTNPLATRHSISCT
jgi:asparagine synthetase B (glutamine-hydrolysing)